MCTHYLLGTMGLSVLGTLTKPMHGTGSNVCISNAVLVYLYIDSDSRCTVQEVAKLNLAGIFRRITCVCPFQTPVYVVNTACMLEASPKCHPNSLRHRLCPYCRNVQIYIYLYIYTHMCIYIYNVHIDT